MKNIKLQNKANTISTLMIKDVIDIDYRNIRLREAGAKPALSRSRNAERSQNATGKPGRRRSGEAEPEDLPDIVMTEVPAKDGEAVRKFSAVPYARRRSEEPHFSFPASETRPARQKTEKIYYLFRGVLKNVQQ